MFKSQLNWTLEFHCSFYSLYLVFPILVSEYVMPTWRYGWYKNKFWGHIKSASLIQYTKYMDHLTNSSHIVSFTQILGWLEWSYTYSGRRGSSWAHTTRCWTWTHGGTRAGKWSDCSSSSAQKRWCPGTRLTLRSSTTKAPWPPVTEATQSMDSWIFSSFQSDTS